MNIGKIKISRLDSNSYVIEDSRKSKGKISLITKIKTFFKYVKNKLIFDANYDIEKLKDSSLDEYIDFLNNEKITLEKAVEKINSDFDEKEENLTSDETIELAQETQVKLDNLKDQKEEIDSKLEDAISEREARKTLREVEDFIPDDVSLEDLNLPNLEPFSNLDSQPIILAQDQIEKVKLPELDENLQPIDYEQEIAEISKEDEEDIHIEPIEGPVSLVQQEPVQEEKITLVSQPNPEEEVMANIQNDYKNSVANIQKEYTENFGKEFSGIVNKIMNETEKYANRQVEEITNVSKEAINNANNNTQRVLDEKSIVEKDRDQYKAHYEQTLNVVEEKNSTIVSKDDEIKALKEEIERKNQEISVRDKNIQELNISISEKDSKISNYEAVIEDYKVTLTTMTRELGRNFQISSQVEPEQNEVSKTK